MLRLSDLVGGRAWKGPVEVLVYGGRGGAERQARPGVEDRNLLLTDKGIRVPDVVWMKPERWAAAKGQTPLSVSPDVCAEVLSSGNTRQEIRMKAGAYLRAGAREVIVVGLKGEVEYYGLEGKRSSSALGIALELPTTLF